MAQDHECDACSNPRAPLLGLLLEQQNFNKRHIRDLTPVFRGNKRCMSQQTCITIVELHVVWPLADLV